MSAMSFPIASAPRHLAGKAVLNIVAATVNVASTLCMTQTR
jgi:hypothetical protein